MVLLSVNRLTLVSLGQAVDTEVKHGHQQAQ